MNNTFRTISEKRMNLRSPNLLHVTNLRHSGPELIMVPKSQSSSHMLESVSVPAYAYSVIALYWFDIKQRVDHIASNPDS